MSKDLKHKEAHCCGKVFNSKEWCEIITESLEDDERGKLFTMFYHLDWDCIFQGILMVNTEFEERIVKISLFTQNYGSHIVSEKQFKDFGFIKEKVKTILEKEKNHSG